MAATGLRNSAVAKHLDVHINTVSKWRSGSQIPSETQMHALAGLLRVSAGWLRYGPPEAEQSAPGVGNAPHAGHRVAEHPELLQFAQELSRRDRELDAEPRRNLPRQLRLMALDFEREVLERGADEPFFRYVHSSFSDPDFVALFAGGPDESPMTEQEAVDEMHAHIAELRAILDRRLQRAHEHSGKVAPGFDR